MLCLGPCCLDKGPWQNTFEYSSFKCGICQLLQNVSQSRMTRVTLAKPITTNPNGQIFCACQGIAIGQFDSHTMFESTPNDNNSNTIMAVTITIHSNSWCQWRDRSHDIASCMLYIAKVSTTRGTTASISSNNSKSDYHIILCVQDFANYGSNAHCWLQCSSGSKLNRRYILLLLSTLLQQPLSSSASQDNSNSKSFLSLLSIMFISNLEVPH